MPGVNIVLMGVSGSGKTTVGQGKYRQRRADDIRIPGAPRLYFLILTGAKELASKAPLSLNYVVMTFSLF